MLQVDPIQSYLNLKIGLPPVLKAGSSGNTINNTDFGLDNFLNNYIFLASKINPVVLDTVFSL